MPQRPEFSRLTQWAGEDEISTVVYPPLIATILTGLTPEVLPSGNGFAPAAKFQRFLLVLNPMLYLAAVLVLLFTAWVLYAWIMAESLEIRWLRRSLATLFILLLTTICLGGGVGLTRRALVSAQRSTLQQLTTRLHQRLSDGRDDEVHAAIRFLAEPPAEGSGHSGDILGRLEELHRALDQADASGQKLALQPKEQL